MTMPAGGQFRVRPPVGVSLRGDIAEVWANDERAGLLYQWTVHGSGSKWEGDALKYRIERQFGGEIELRLFLRNVSGVVELRAYGHIVGDVEADGVMHKSPLRIKGTRLEVA